MLGYLSGRASAYTRGKTIHRSRMSGRQSTSSKSRCWGVVSRINDPLNGSAVEVNADDVMVGSLLDGAMLMMLNELLADARSIGLVNERSIGS